MKFDRWTLISEVYQCYKISNCKVCWHCIPVNLSNMDCISYVFFDSSILNCIKLFIAISLQIVLLACVLSYLCSKPALVDSGSGWVSLQLKKEKTFFIMYAERIVLEHCPRARKSGCNLKITYILGGSVVLTLNALTEFTMVIVC